MDIRNRPYDQTAKHTFALETVHHDDPSPTVITLSGMAGLPLPWQLAEGALRFMLQDEQIQHLPRRASYEDLTTVHPDTDEDNDIILALSYRPRPDDSSLDAAGVAAPAIIMLFYWATTSLSLSVKERRRDSFPNVGTPAPPPDTEPYKA